MIEIMGSFDIGEMLFGIIVFVYFSDKMHFYNFRSQLVRSNINPIPIWNI